MTAKLNGEAGKARYAKRRETVEPAFGQIKEQQGARRFLRRGMAACQAEWKLHRGRLVSLWWFCVFAFCATLTKSTKAIYSVLLRHWRLSGR
jgi:Transposase DDE domain